MYRDGSLSPLVPAFEQPRGPAALRLRRRSRPRVRRLDGSDPRFIEPRVRHEEGHRRHRRRRRVLRSVPAVGDEHRVRLRAHRRSCHRHRRQPAAGARGLSRHRRVRKGGSVRAHVRRVQRAAGDVRRRAGVPPRYRPGVRRHHPSRRQAVVRLLRGDDATRADHHPQGLRRRVRRHELEVDRRRHRVSRGRRPRSP